MNTTNKKFTSLLLAVSLSVSTIAWADEACLTIPSGESVVITMEACPVATTSPFFRGYYSMNDGTIGEGCWIKHGGNIIMVWKDHPRAVYPVSEFKLCEKNK